MPYGRTISPDGKFVVSLESDALDLRDIETGKLVRKIDVKSTSRGNE